MRPAEFEHPYLAISGVIGSGKSTACKIIADRFGFTFYLEPSYKENKWFGVKGKAFLSETDFYIKSLDIVRLARKEIKKTGVVIDVPPQQHANDYPYLLLDENELPVFQNMCATLENRYKRQLMKPTLIVYLSVEDPNVILERIHLRGRSFEQQITTDDIAAHDRLNRDWIAKSQIPVLDILTDHMDIPNSREAQDFMVNLVRQKLNSHV
jgi:deoxyadenosine/deoxycytidine kinase